MTPSALLPTWSTHQFKHTSKPWAGSSPYVLQLRLMNALSSVKKSSIGLIFGDYGGGHLSLTPAPVHICSIRSLRWKEALSIQAPTSALAIRCTVGAAARYSFRRQYCQLYLKTRATAGCHLACMLAVSATAARAGIERSAQALCRGETNSCISHLSSNKIVT
jgi:hypothetical protein